MARVQPWGETLAGSSPRTSSNQIGRLGHTSWWQKEPASKKIILHSTLFCFFVCLFVSYCNCDNSSSICTRNCSNHSTYIFCHSDSNLPARFQDPILKIRQLRLRSCICVAAMRGPTPELVVFPPPVLLPVLPAFWNSSEVSRLGNKMSY